MDSPETQAAENNEHPPGETAPPLTQVPWEKRKEIGRIRAYLQTAWIAMFRPSELAQLLETPVCKKHAKIFRRVTFQLTVIITMTPLIAAILKIMKVGGSRAQAAQAMGPITLARLVYRQF